MIQMGRSSYVFFGLWEVPLLKWSRRSSSTNHPISFITSSPGSHRSERWMKCERGDQGMSKHCQVKSRAMNVQDGLRKYLVPFSRAGVIICNIIFALVTHSVQAKDAALTFSPSAVHRALILVELPAQLDNTENEAILREWDAFAGSIEDKQLLDVKILWRSEPDEDVFSSLSNFTPFVIPHAEYTWSEVLESILEDSSHMTILGLSAAGTLPSHNLGESLGRLLEAFGEMPEDPTAVVSRSRVRRHDSSAAEKAETGGEWMSDMLVAQAWCNKPLITLALGADRELASAKVNEFSTLEAISLLLKGLAKGQEDNHSSSPRNVRVVDGTDEICLMVDNRVVDVWCEESKVSSSSGLRCDPPNTIITGHAVKSTRPDSEQSVVRNVEFAIGDLGLAAVSNIHGNSTPVSFDFQHSSWPPSYILETVSSKEGLVIVTSVNCGYLDMAMNFLSSVQRQSDEKVLFIATDEVAFEHLDHIIPGHVAIMPASESRRKHATEAGVFGNGAFKMQTLIRPDILIAILEQGYAVLWTDIDIVWLANPMPLLPAIGHPASPDLVYQDYHGIACTCFLHVRCTPQSMELMRSWKTEIEESRPHHDQSAFQKPLQEHIAFEELKAVILPEEIMPNGHEFFANHKRYDGRVRIVHNNRIKGHDEKKNRFIENDLWFLGEFPFPNCTADKGEHRG